ncbi:Tkl protein kinase, partial [Globisporangium polare]
LISEMCADDPKERPSIGFVVNRLKQFLLATEQTLLTSIDSLADRDQEDQSVDGHKFAELEGATIPHALQSIQSRCEKLREHEWMVIKAFPALQLIFALLQERKKTAVDVEVVRFCSTLARFQRYLRTAVSEKSVFELARSRQVAETHHVVYSDLDRLLDLLE